MKHLTVTQRTSEFNRTINAPLALSESKIIPNIPASGNSDIKVYDGQGNLKKILKVEDEMQKSLERDIKVINPFKKARD